MLRNCEGLILGSIEADFRGRQVSHTHFREDFEIYKSCMLFALLESGLETTKSAPSEHHPGENQCTALNSEI